MSSALERGEHGTPTTWRQGCRCDACRKALRRASKVWGATSQLRRGRDPSTRVHPRRMLDHADALIAAGVTQRQVALRAGIAPSTLTRARRRGVTISRIVERSVLAVPLP